MRKSLVVLAFLASVLCLAAPASAQSIGPYCFQPAPFTDIFAMFFTPSGGNQMDATGRNVLTGAPVTGAVILTGGTAVISFAASTPPTGSSHAFFGSANVSLATLSGAGRCETLNSTGGCGLGTFITLGIVACPAGALGDAPAASEMRQKGGGGGGGQ